MITHTGPTTLNQGLLRLLNTSAFNSPITLNGGVLQADTNGANNILAKPITGANPNTRCCINSSAKTSLPS